MRAWLRETPGSDSTTSLAGSRPMVVSAASKRNRWPRPLPSAMVSSKDTLEIPAEEDLVGDGSEQHEEDGREDAADERQQQLDRRLVGELLRPLRALDAHLGGEDAEDLSQRCPHPVCMHERLHEPGEALQLDARGQVAQRLVAGLA